MIFCEVQCVSVGICFSVFLDWHERSLSKYQHAALSRRLVCIRFFDFRFSEKHRAEPTRFESFSYWLFHSHKLKCQWGCVIKWIYSRRIGHYIKQADTTWIVLYSTIKNFDWSTAHLRFLINAKVEMKKNQQNEWSGETLKLAVEPGEVAVVGGVVTLPLVRCVSNLRIQTVWAAIRSWTFQSWMEQDR